MSMPATGGPLSDEGKDTSLLPTDARQEVKPDNTDILKEKLRAADTKLLKLEEELDVLLYCAKQTREERTELTLGRLTISATSPNEPALEGSNQLIDEYLALTLKGQAIDAAIKALKKECASMRSEYDYHFYKLRSASPRTLDRQRLRGRNSLARGGPESGFTDRDDVADRILMAEENALSIGGVVGAFGAGITYTTLFSASRGRLDLIAWAFTCFLVVVIDCGALRIFATPRHGQITKIFRMEYSGSAEQKLLVYGLFVGAPMVAGFLFLAISVAILDPDTPVLSSRRVIQAAGYLPVATLGYFVVAMIITAILALVLRFLPGSRTHIPEDTRKSLLSPVKEKLYFLPGGDGYSLYRSKRRLNATNME